VRPEHQAYLLDTAKIGVRGHIIAKIRQNHPRCGENRWGFAKKKDFYWVVYRPTPGAQLGSKFIGVSNPWKAIAGEKGDTM